MSTYSASEGCGPSQDGPSIHIDGVGLRFKSYGDSHPSIKQAFINTILRRKYAQGSEFWLYRDLSLRVERGCRLGILGRNGAGKTTLLKMICGIYRPTYGSIAVRGRMAPLIELGAGMIGELSGAENIMLNGALLGFSKREMRPKVEQILDFAGLQEFREMPIKYYSSGMLMRLAFSVATDIDPEVLLIDEIFASGDADFIRKAKDRMDRLLESSHIVVLVSHQLELIEQICNRALWIERGQIHADGHPTAVKEKYLASVS
jgi:ABC-type polysaccharide/polyol phosphate transport system ATPase subunit